MVYVLCFMTPMCLKKLVKFDMCVDKGLCFMFYPGHIYPVRHLVQGLCFMFYDHNVSREAGVISHVCVDKVYVLCFTLDTSTQ